MLTVTALLVLAAVSIQAVSYQALIEEQWENFKLEHGKFYQSEDEDQYRQTVFIENLHKVTEHNRKYEMGLTSYTMAINQLADLTEEEFLQFYTSPMPEDFLNSNDTESNEYEKVSDEDLIEDFVTYDEVSSEADVNVVGLPGHVDWREKHAVTPVKNQGRCGSCWSFSATGALEAQWFKKTGRLISLSEQNLLDCSAKYGNKGCDGGWMHWAFQYVKDNGGIDTEQSYPYEAHVGNCRYNPRGVGARVRGEVQFKGEQKLQQVVATVGPVSIAAEVGHTFQMYHGGVYDEPACGNKLNHAMLIVGYGSEGGRDYWLVKNSWGAQWGDRGYIKMSRNRRNQCGISDASTYPLV